MAAILTVDTCFLIDLERERRRRLAGPALAFLQAHQEAEYRLSVVAFGEFAAGFDRSDHPELDVIRNGFDIVETDEATGLFYAQLYRHLRSSNQLIGANDLWIASHALRHGLPLVTRNSNEFSRVPGLTVVAY